MPTAISILCLGKALAVQYTKKPNSSKYIDNMWVDTSQQELGNDIFCPHLANPQVTPKLETLMTTNKPQMVKLQGTQAF